MNKKLLLSIGTLGAVVAPVAAVVACGSSDDTPAKPERPTFEGNQAELVTRLTQGTLDLSMLPLSITTEPYEQVLANAVNNQGNSENLIANSGIYYKGARKVNLHSFTNTGLNFQTENGDYKVFVEGASYNSDSKLLKIRFVDESTAITNPLTNKHFVNVTFDLNDASNAFPAIETSKTGHELIEFLIPKLIKTIGGTNDAKSNLFTFLKAAVA